MLRFGSNRSLYRSHVPTTLLDKTLLGLSSAVLALVDPKDARHVGVVGEVTGKRALRNIHNRMLRHPVGRTILDQRPVITQKSLGDLARLPDNSFGAAYKVFLERHSFSPDERGDDVWLLDDPDLAYVMLRYRQVHDFWHVLYDLPPTFVGEVALKWLEAAQTGLPMCALGAVGGGVRLSAAQLRVISQRVLPWASRHAINGPDLLSVYYERELGRPLDELRRELRVDPLSLAPK